MKQISDAMTAMGIPFSPEKTPEGANSLAQEVSAVLTKTQNQKQQALIQALLPYLRPGKQRRLERAMQVAQLSNLAELALRASNNMQTAEGTHV